MLGYVTTELLLYVLSIGPRLLVPIHTVPVANMRMVWVGFIGHLLHTLLLLMCPGPFIVSSWFLVDQALRRWYDPVIYNPSKLASVCNGMVA